MFCLSSWSCCGSLEGGGHQSGPVSVVEATVWTGSTREGRGLQPQEPVPACVGLGRKGSLRIIFIIIFITYLLFIDLL